MKALTISQPYASLIAQGDKWVENRTWYTHHRGRLAIHAGKTSRYIDRKTLATFPTGRIIAIATLAACVCYRDIVINGTHPTRWCQHIPGTRITWQQASNHTHAEGPWCWILEDIYAFATNHHVPINGSQGLWDWHCHTTFAR